jgi:hypothetical protein
MECGMDTLESLGEHIIHLSGQLNCLERRWLALIAEFDRRRGWAGPGIASCAHWLNWQCGIDLGTARERLRVAHALEQLPKIGASMQRGELSYSKVRAVTRIADAGNEDVLLMWALHGSAGQVERIVRYYRRAQECEELNREQRQQWHRSLHHEYLDDGSILIKARLPAETGRLVIHAVEAALEYLPDSPPAELKVADGSPHPSARRADALGLVAESFLAAGPRSQSGAERQQIVVHVDAQVLQERCAGRCEFEQGPSIAAETARRLACDASLVELSHDESGNVLNIGRKTRSIPPAIRRALNARDRGCRFPGCHHDRYVDGHHIRHWADGGETRLGNLVTLCRYHHRVVHEEGMSIQVLDDGALRFCRPDGREVPTHPPMLGPGMTPVVDAEVAGIDPRAAMTRRFADTRADYGLTVSALFLRRGRDVSAETLRDIGE